MEPKPNYSDGPASGAQPMATSTPGRCTRSTTMHNLEVSPSSSLAIRENEEQSPPTAVTPTTNITGVANSSLVQRVPRSLRNIKGRSPDYTSSLEAARSPKGRPKKQVSKTQMTKSPKAEPEPSKAEVGSLKVQSKSPKTEAKAQKNATPKEQSPSTSPPAVLTPTTNTTGVANTSLAQRVPRSLRSIKGRSPVYTSSLEGAKTQMTKSPKSESKTPKLETESPKVKLESQKAEAKATGNTTPKEQSPSTFPPAVVTPTTNTAGVANTSLAQRVPRSLRHIKGRCPVRPVGFYRTAETAEKVARSPKGRPKKQVSKTQMTKSPKAEPEPSKAEVGSPKIKLESQKAEAKAQNNATPKEQSLSTSPLRAVTPTTNTTGVINTSLAQRVPRSFRHIKGRRPLRPVSFYRSAEAGRNQTKSPKAEPESTIKLESPKADAKASDTPKPEPDGASRAQKRQHSPEEAISEQASTSAKATRASAEIPPAPPLPYQLYQVNMRNCPVGLLILNLDQQLEPNGVTAAIQCQENPSRVTEPTPPVIEINTLDTRPIENPYRRTTEPIPEKEAPKTKNYCLIM